MCNLRARNSKVLMKLKTPGSERKEKKGTASRALHSPQPHPGHTYLPFARCLDTLCCPSPPPIMPQPGRPESLGTYNKVSAPAEHLSRHAAVRARRVLGVQDVTANETGWQVSPCPQPLCPPLPQPLSGSSGLFTTRARAGLGPNRSPQTLPFSQGAWLQEFFLLPLSQRPPHTPAQPQGP